MILFGMLLMAFAAGIDYFDNNPLDLSIENSAEAAGNGTDKIIHPGNTFFYIGVFAVFLGIVFKWQGWGEK